MDKVIKRDIEEEARRKQKIEAQKQEVEKLKTEKKLKEREDREYLYSEIVRLREPVMDKKPMPFRAIAELFPGNTGANIHRIYKKILKEREQKKKLQEIEDSLPKL